MVTFSPPRNPDAPITEETLPRIRVAEFGDGYTQRSADGLNHLPRKLTLKWTRISWLDAESIVSFLRDRGATESFDYKPPGFSSSIKFICPNWKREILDTGASIHATFVEVFD